MKKFAFTLAEVLITLAIIGVVAALTIPALMNKTNDAELKAAWKKEFSIITQAYNQAKQDEGGDLSPYFTAINSALPLFEKITAHLSVSKSCNIPYTADDSSICGAHPTLYAADVYKTLAGLYMGYTNFTHGQVVLNDGAQLYYRGYAGCNIWVDVNGPGKKPNTLGKDLFGVVVTKDKVIPMGGLGSNIDESACSSAPLSSPRPSGSAGGSDYAGAGCASKYLNE